MATSGEDRDSRPERERVRDVYDRYARDPYYKDNLYRDDTAPLTRFATTTFDVEGEPTRPIPAGPGLG